MLSRKSFFVVNDSKSEPYPMTTPRYKPENLSEQTPIFITDTFTSPPIQEKVKKLKHSLSQMKEDIKTVYENQQEFKTFVTTQAPKFDERLSRLEQEVQESKGLKRKVQELENENETLKKQLSTKKEPEQNPPAINVKTFVSVCKNLKFEANPDGDLYVEKKIAIDALISKMKENNPNFKVGRETIWETLTGQCSDLSQKNPNRKPHVVFRATLWNSFL